MGRRVLPERELNIMSVVLSASKKGSVSPLNDGERKAHQLVLSRIIKVGGAKRIERMSPARWGTFKLKQRGRVMAVRVKVFRRGLEILRVRAQEAAQLSEKEREVSQGGWRARAAIAVIKRV